MYCPYLVISIIPTFLYMAHTLLFESIPLLRPSKGVRYLHPYLIFVQLLPVFTHKYDTNCIDFASYLLHSHIAYIRSIPFQLFAICATLIIFMFSSHRLLLHSNFPLQISKRHHRMSKPKPS